MEEKFKMIESKKELLAEIAVTTGKAFGTIKNHWFNPVEIPSKYEKVVEKLIDRRLEMQKIVKRVEDKFFKDNPINL